MIIGGGRMPGLKQPAGGGHGAADHLHDLGVGFLLGGLVGLDGAVGLDVDGAEPGEVVAQDFHHRPA